MAPAPVDPRDLVYFVASTRRRLEARLMKRPPMAQGVPIAQAIGALERTERDLRAMYPFDPTGL